MIVHGHWTHTAKGPLRKLASVLTCASAPVTPVSFPAQSFRRHHINALFGTAPQAGGFSPWINRLSPIHPDCIQESSRISSRFKALIAGNTQKRSFTRASAPRLKNGQGAASSPQHAGKGAKDSGTGIGAGSGSGSGASASVSAAGIKSSQNLSAASTTSVSASASKASEKASNAEQNKLDWKIFKELSSYIWPKDDRGVKIRVVTALSLLVMGKILNVQVPFFFKDIIDKLNVEFPVEATVLSVVGAVILGYGLARAGSSIFGELRNAVFAAVAQKAIRRVSANVFEHLHRLDMSFHLTKQTGGLSRAIDRGTKYMTQDHGSTD